MKAMYDLAQPRKNKDISRVFCDDLRSELARKYLLQSALSVEDIARKLGFTESRSFIRYFKGYTGMTSVEFRHAELLR